MSRGLKLTLLVVVVLVGGGAWLAHRAEQRRPQGTDAQQIQDLIFDARDAGVRRDAGGVMRHVSRQYRDESGFGYGIVGRQVRRVLGDAEEAPSIETEILAISVAPNSRRALVDVRVAMEGAVPPLPLNTTLHLSLVKEPVRYYLLFPGEEWRVVAISGYGAVGY